MISRTKVIIGKGKALYYAAMAGLGLALCGVPTDAKADGGISTMFTSVGNEITSILPVLKTIFALGGVLMVATGLFKWMQASNRQEPKGPAITYIVVGALLLALFTFASMATKSVGLTAETLG